MSDIKIISGKFKNLKLHTPASFEVRPTSVRSRKALFDSLGSFDNLNVIDVCSGVGTLALEAASRGADKVLCLEKNSLHCECIVDNFTRSGFSQFSVEKCDVTKYTKYDIFGADVIFADPPYRDSAQVFANLAANKSFVKSLNDALLVWEMPAKLEDFMGFGEVELFSQGTLKIFDNVKFLFIKLNGGLV
ncbi:RsmD family RNA methyltransferase [Lentisphaerota bacterium WC36G]|nr:RsmD family RNA methyltransferase [Lentisphaerae bacterium WC36]